MDIVEQQLRVALGQGLSIRPDTISSKGHAIECRTKAEHPLSFAPVSGKVNKFVAPSGEGIRLDSALYSGYSIPQFYDSLIAKLICHESDRKKSDRENELCTFHAEDFWHSDIDTSGPS